MGERRKRPFHLKGFIKDCERKYDERLKTASNLFFNEKKKTPHAFYSASNKQTVLAVKKN